MPRLSNHNREARAGAATALGGQLWRLGTDADVRRIALDRDQIDEHDLPPKTIAAGGNHSCAIRTNDTITCWGYNGAGQSDAPSGAFKAGGGPVGAGAGSVVVSKGALGPTSLGPGLGTPCASGTQTCRWINIELSGFDPGQYTISCSHDGWRGSGPSAWWTFTHNIGNSGSAVIGNQCFIDFATLTGTGAYVTVAKSGADTVTSNTLK